MFVNHCAFVWFEMDITKSILTRLDRRRNEDHKWDLTWNFELPGYPNAPLSMMKLNDKILKSPGIQLVKNFSKHQAIQWIFWMQTADRLCRGFFKNSEGDLLHVLRFLGRLYDFYNFVIFSLMTVMMICSKRATHFMDSEIIKYYQETSNWNSKSSWKS